MKKETLDSALTKAAAELGWTARFATEYQLDSRGRIRIPSSEEVFLRGTLLPALEIKISYFDGESNFIHLYTGFPYGFAGEKKVQQYIDAVSRNLP